MAGPPVLTIMTRYAYAAFPQEEGRGAINLISFDALLLLAYLINYIMWFGMPSITQSQVHVRNPENEWSNHFIFIFLEFAKNVLRTGLVMHWISPARCLMMTWMMRKSHVREKVGWEEPRSCQIQQSTDNFLKRNVSVEIGIMAVLNFLHGKNSLYVELGWSETCRVHKRLQSVL